MKLMFVHGIAQGGKNPDDLKKEWLEALERGMKRAGLATPKVDVAFPYYGDMLDKFVAQMDLPIGDEVAAKGGAIDAEYAEFRFQVAEQMRVGAKITDAQVAAEMGGDVNEKGPQNWWVTRALVRLIDRTAPGVSGFTIEEFLRDVFLYTRRTAVQTAIDKVVTDLLTPEPTLMVGHSLGSVVAYNVLRSAKPPISVPMLITVGSPLGIRPIRNNLATPLKNPSGKRGWYNAYDPRDIVALYPLDGKNFNVTPKIVNNGRVKNWTENRHTIWGYLDDKNVARTIHECLTA